MRRWIFMAMGGLPIPLGFYLNHQAATEWRYVIPTGMLTRVGVGVLVLWFALGWASDKFVGSKLEALLYVNALAAVMLVLVLFQQVVIGQFWAGPVGLMPQWFYLPMMFLAAHTLAVFGVGGMAVVTAVSFGLMVMVSALGVKMAPTFRGKPLLSR